MLSNKRKTLGNSATIIGIALTILHVYNQLFIHYFSAIGVREWGSALGLSIILTVGGLLIFLKKDIAEYLIFGFIAGNFLDRIIVILAYFDNISIDVILMPLVSAIIMGLILKFTLEKRLDDKNYRIRAFLITLIVVLLPKFFC